VAKRSDEKKEPLESKLHAWEILYVVTRGLETGSGPFSERLRDAHINGMHQLVPERFPWKDLREPLRDILDYFTLDPRRGGLIVEGLSQDDQMRIANQIFDLFVKVSRRKR
jgi:hypothetical protein